VTTRPGTNASLERDVAATIALALYSFVVAVGFARVFSNWRFLNDLAVLIVIVHGGSLFFRRARVSGWLAIPAVSVISLWALVAVHYRATLTWLVPRGETWDQVSLEVGLVRDQFQTAVAPVTYGAGWAMLAGLAIIVAIVMSDSFAFRAEARGEALVPGGVLFIFIAALGSPRLRVLITAALVAAGIFAVVALRALHDRSRRVELTATRGPASMVVPAALATATVVAVLAGFIGPRIPGAEAEPLYETRGQGGGVTNVISPLVDIRSRLTNQGNVELFRVNADSASYWRAITLPEFDGRTFRLPKDDLVPTEQAPRPTTSGALLRQQIQVLTLGSNLVPAAANVVAVQGESSRQVAIEIRSNAQTGTLVALDHELEPGDLFLIDSDAPRFSPEQLRAATTNAAPDPLFSELPANLPDIVFELAAEVTASATTPYDKALALQTWFQNDFEYSLEVQSGHGSNVIESFLNERIGYCEQFAATYSAMARTLEIPSRVAVGFTPGLLSDDGWYSVRGKHAHAWPELWFDGIGWVAFEPTPGRGAPGAENYTGLPEDQDDTPPTAAGGGGSDPATASTLPPVPTTLPDSAAANDPRTANTEAPLGPAEIDEGLPLDSLSSSGSGVPWRFIIVAGSLAVIGITPLAIRLARRRAHRGRSAIERVEAAWARACLAVERSGVPSRASMTAYEWAMVTASELPVAARPMQSLAEVLDEVTFAKPGSIDLDAKGRYGLSLGHDCELWSNQVGRIATDQMSMRARVRRYFTDLG
jgi:transglutaminase-like putative cysteine protease